jgi:NAD(P)-dependent dehydrogenase (short-subunit alcohol dehydrogenase family)
LLIIGASSRIGGATARMAADRYRLVLAARRRGPWRRALRDHQLGRRPLTAPPGVEINEILIRPTAQRG